MRMTDAGLPFATGMSSMENLWQTFPVVIGIMARSAIEIIKPEEEWRRKAQFVQLWTCARLRHRVQLPSYVDLH